MVLYQRKNYTFPRIQRGSNFFPMLISIETHITCDFDTCYIILSGIQTALDQYKVAKSGRTVDWSRYIWKSCLELTY